MKYIAVTKDGDPEVLRVAEMPDPEPREGEVLIEVEAAGVSRADSMQRRGEYPPPPGASPILGLDVAGTVVGLGRSVAGVREGDRVVALCNGGGYAERVCVPIGQVLPLPDNWSFVEGATLCENAFTVYDNVLVRGRLQRAECLLVHGGTSGIGTMAVMFGLARGARVIATAGSDEKCRALLRIGADVALNYRSVDFVEAVRDCTDGRGADVILDIVGGDYIERDLHALAIDGRIVCLATQRGTTASIDLRYLLGRRGTILGSNLRPRSDAEKAAIARGLRNDLWPQLNARHPIAPIVDSVYAFSDAAGAHRRLESNDHIGKIVLVPDAPRERRK